MAKICVLDDEKVCDDCGECMKCDLDPNKVCDNCMRCVKKSNADYLAIEIDEVINATSPDAADPEPAEVRAADSNTPEAPAADGKPRKSPC